MSGSFKSRSIRSAARSLSQSMASRPDAAVAVVKPSRRSDFSTSRSRPRSSSTINTVAGGAASDITTRSDIALDLGHLDQGDEQAQLFDRFGEFVVVHRFDQVIVATECMAPLHFRSALFPYPPLFRSAPGYGQT